MTKIPIPTSTRSAAPGLAAFLEMVAVMEAEIAKCPSETLKNDLTMVLTGLTAGGTNLASYAQQLENMMLWVIQENKRTATRLKEIDQMLQDLTTASGGVR